MSGARTPINNGLMLNNLDAGGHKIVNLDTSNLPIGGVGAVIPTEKWITSIGPRIGATGTLSDPFDGSTQASFQAALNAATPGTVFHVLGGTYSHYALTLSQSVTIQGTRDAIFTQKTGSGTNPIFTLSGSTSDIAIIGITLQHGTAYVEENNLAAIIGACHTLRLSGIYSSDFNNTLNITGGTTVQVIVEDCEFVYQYGRAGVSNIAPYTNPCSSIVGNPIRLIVQNNKYNGLVDPTFTGVTGNPPASQFAPADNFDQTGDHAYCVIDSNDILNHGIEAIDVSRSSPIGTYTPYTVTNNRTVAAAGTALIAGPYAPGVSILRCQADVIGNKIYGTPVGIDISFNSYDEVNNVVNVTGNICSHVLTGIRSVNESGKSNFNNNVVWNTSQPCKTLFGQISKPDELYGILTDRGSCTNNVLFADEPVWDASTTLTSRSVSPNNVFTVSSVTGITPNTGALISYANNSFSIFPVQGISGLNITVSQDYATAYPSVTSGTLFYAQTFSNQYTGGIVVQNGGAVYADNNTIIGHRYDLQQLNSGTITTSQHRTRNCHVVQPDGAVFIHLDPVFTDIPRLDAQNVYTGLTQTIQKASANPEQAIIATTTGSALLTMIGAGGGNAILGLNNGMRIGSVTGIQAAGFTDQGFFSHAGGLYIGATSVQEAGAGFIQTDNGYKSGDGTAGATATIGGIAFKQGLYVSGNPFPLSVSSGGTNATTALAAIQNLTPKGADIVAAGTTDLSTATGMYLNVTGNTTITSFGTVSAGSSFKIRFTGTPQITYNASSMILPGSANITVGAGDVAIFESLGSGNWRCTDYFRFATAP